MKRELTYVELVERSLMKTLRKMVVLSQVYVLVDQHPSTFLK